MCKTHCNTVVYFDATVTPTVYQYCNNELVLPFEKEQGYCGVCSGKFYTQDERNAWVSAYTYNFGKKCKIEGCNEVVTGYWACTCGICNTHHARRYDTE